MFSLLILLARSIACVPVIILMERYNRTAGGTGWIHHGNPFIPLARDKFTNILHGLHTDTGNGGVTIYVERYLSLEDLATKDKSGETVFPTLKRALERREAIFMLAVENPYGILKLMFPHNLIVNQSEYNGEVADPNGITYIHLDNLDQQQRREELCSHDDFIRETCESGSGVKRRLCIYTGREDTRGGSGLWRRYISPTGPRVDQAGITVNTRRLKMYINNMDIQAPTNSRSLMTDEHYPVAKDISSDGHSFVTKLRAYNYELYFYFTFDEHEWILDNVTMNDNGGAVLSAIRPRISAEWGRSYVCNTPLRLRHATGKPQITISKYQLEIVKPGSHRQLTGFGNPKNCNLFVTVPILCALLIVALVVIILFIGIMILMDVRTNNRYDDPRAPTIDVRNAE